MALRLPMPITVVFKRRGAYRARLRFAHRLAREPFEFQAMRHFLQCADILTTVLLGLCTHRPPVLGGRSADSSW